MSFLRRSADTPDTPPTTAGQPDQPVVGKGRPTPKRSVAEGRRGPVPPAPKTQREALKRARAINSGSSGRKLTKEERRQAALERREAMARGDAGHLMRRDQGKIRAWVRDQVDARRNLAGLMLPLAFGGMFVLLIPHPYVQAYGPLAMMLLIISAVVDSILFGRQLSKHVRINFPKGDDANLSNKTGALGFYAFNRSVLPRRWRVPRPRVDKRGQPLK